MGETVHDYGAKPVGLPLEDSDRVGATAEEALRAALNLLVFPIATVVRFDPAHDQPRVASKVDLYCLRLGLVLPVGVGDVAEQVRAVLGAGFDGWVLPPLPSTPQLLQTYDDDLPLKVANLLRRREFRTAEEVALVPDEALLELGGMGPTLLARLRAVIPHTRGLNGHTPGATAQQGRDGAGWIGTPTLLHRLGQATSSLAGVLAHEGGAEPSARVRASEDLAALRAELATFAATNLEVSTSGRGEAEGPVVWCGNAADDGGEHRGWFVGDFLEAATGIRASEDVELKWGQHTRGDHRDDWAVGDRRSTLTLLVSGGPWRVQLPEHEHTLTRPGDYLVFGPGIAHSWHADGDTIMLTIRWPSRP